MSQIERDSKINRKAQFPVKKRKWKMKRKEMCLQRKREPDNV